MKWNSTEYFVQLFESSAPSKHERLLSYKIIVSLCLRTTPGMSAHARFESGLYLAVWLPCVAAGMATAGYRGCDMTASRRHICRTRRKPEGNFLCMSRRHAWVVSVLYEGECLASRSRHFAARATAPDIRTRRCSVCGRTSLGGWEKTKLLPVAVLGRPALGLVTTRTQTTLCSASMAVIYIQMHSFRKTCMQNYSSIIRPIFKPV